MLLAFMIVSYVAQTLPSYSKSICGEIVNVLFYMYLIFAGEKKLNRKIYCFFTMVPTRY